jgi:hypothetical protein
MVTFSVADYVLDAKAIFNIIRSTFIGDVIVRSSASTEDNTSTNAGHFPSIQFVNSQDETSVFSAIETVIYSYKRDGLGTSEMIFIQNRLRRYKYLALHCLLILKWVDRTFLSTMMTAASQILLQAEKVRSACT